MAGPVSTLGDVEARLRAIEALVTDKPNVAGDGRLAQASLDGRYPAHPSNWVVATGDSITSASIDKTNNVLASSWYTHMVAESDGVIPYVYPAAAGGATSTTLLADLPTEVIARLPRGGTAIIAWGRNDSQTLATTVANDQAAVAQLLAAGIRPVFCTMTPVGVVGGSAPNAADVLYTRELNEWRRRYCARNGFAMIDFFAVVSDPATGRYATGMSTDGTHPTVAANKLMGAAAWAVMEPLVNKVPSPIAVDAVDPLNLYTNGLFLTTTGGNRPTGFAAYAGSTTGSIGAVAGFLGNAWTVNRNNAGDAAYLGSVDISTGFSVGDVVQFSCRADITASSGGLQAEVGARFINPSVSPSQLAQWKWASVDIDNSILVGPEVAVPTGTTAIRLLHYLSSGTGTSIVGQFTLRNLTTGDTLTI